MSSPELDRGGHGALRDSGMEGEAESLICLYELLITHGWLDSGSCRAESRGRAHVQAGRAEGSSV